MNIHYLIERPVADPEQQLRLMQIASDALKAVAKPVRALPHPAGAKAIDQSKGAISDGLKAARLARLTAICLHLPQAELKDKGKHRVFMVSGRVFAYYLSDYHEDGLVGICCKTRPGESEALIAGAQAKWYIPFHLGLKGWIGLRIDRNALDWGEVSDLVRGSYRHIASKSASHSVDLPTEHAALRNRKVIPKVARSVSALMV